MRPVIPALAALCGALAVALPTFTVDADEAPPAAAAAPAAASTANADELLRKAGALLFPEDFTAKIELTNTGGDGSETVYQLKLYKHGADKVRADFLFPPLEEGRRMLRVGDQIWMYVADLKRPVKMSPKQSLMGSDFNNGDLMRLNFEEDYTASISSEDDKTIVLELKARNKAVAYDRVLYTLEKSSLKSVKQEFYTASGRLVKIMEYQEWKNFDGFERPSLFTMTNALATQQKSVMRYLEFEAGKTLPDAQFRPDAIARQ